MAIKKKPTKQNANPKKTCSHCQKQMVVSTNFYASASPLHSSDGRLSICKTCLNSMVDPNDIESVYTILRQIDKVFLVDVWQTSVEEAKDKNSIFGKYIKTINSLSQYKMMTWKHSIFNGNENKVTKANTDTDRNEDNYVIKSTKINVSQELVMKFGKGYTPEQYIAMEKFYDDMIAARDISTPEHKKLLIIMCRLQTKIDKALEEDDISTFEKLHKQYQELIKNSGFRPIDKTASDVASGIRTFSQIFAEIEKDGFIKPAPIEVNQDIVDKTIQYLLNYQIKLLNMHTLSEPPVDTPKVDDTDV